MSRPPLLGRRQLAVLAAISLTLAIGSLGLDLMFRRHFNSAEGKGEVETALQSLLGKAVKIDQVSARSGLRLSWRGLKLPAPKPRRMQGSARDTEQASGAVSIDGGVDIDLIPYVLLGKVKLTADLRSVGTRAALRVAAQASIWTISDLDFSSGRYDLEVSLVETPIAWLLRAAPDLARLLPFGLPPDCCNAQLDARAALRVQNGTVVSGWLAAALADIRLRHAKAKFRWRLGDANAHLFVDQGGWRLADRVVLEDRSVGAHLEFSKPRADAAAQATLRARPLTLRAVAAASGCRSEGAISWSLGASGWECR